MHRYWFNYKYQQFRLALEGSFAPLQCRPTSIALVPIHLRAHARHLALGIYQGSFFWLDLSLNFSVRSTSGVLNSLKKGFTFSPTPACCTCRPAKKFKI